MKKIFSIFTFFLFSIIFSSNFAQAFETNYRQIYMDMQIPTFTYMHGIDPGQYYDNKDATYSTYPLFRLTSPIYFKAITIVPGYYLLTPIAHKGENYLLFKDNGIVKYTIPVYKKEIVPIDFYETHLPKPKLTVRQAMSKNFYHFIGTHFKSAKKKPAAQTYLEVEDLDNNFISLVVYYGPYRYYTIFRTVKM